MFRSSCDGKKKQRHSSSKICIEHTLCGSWENNASTAVTGCTYKIWLTQVREWGYLGSPVGTLHDTVMMWKPVFFSADFYTGVFGVGARAFHLMISMASIWSGNAPLLSNLSSESPFGWLTTRYQSDWAEWYASVKYDIISSDTGEPYHLID